jgi:hypothetical protein
MAALSPGAVTELEEDFDDVSAVAHRVVGSAAVSLARHSPVPLVVVP